MLDRYTRTAVTRADLNYEPFPDVTEAIPELAEGARLHTGLHTRPVSASPPAPAKLEPTPRNQRECEGGDLNPYANYGASTSS